MVRKKIVFQEEPNTISRLSKRTNSLESTLKKKLIDSMQRGLDIPKLYLYKADDSETYDCVDGQQRIVSIIEFFSGELTLLDGRNIDQLPENERNDLFEYKFTVAIITKAEEDDLRLLFSKVTIRFSPKCNFKLTCNERRY